MSTDSIEQSLNDNVFLKNIMDNSNLKNTPLNQKYWFKQVVERPHLDVLSRGTKQTSFFIVKKYDDKGYILNDAGVYVKSDTVTLSDNITTGLVNKDYFFFDDYGNIQLCLENCNAVPSQTSESQPQDVLEVGHTNADGGPCNCFKYEKW